MLVQTFSLHMPIQEEFLTMKEEEREVTKAGGFYYKKLRRHRFSLFLHWFKYALPLFVGPSVKFSNPLKVLDSLKEINSYQ